MQTKTPMYLNLILFTLFLLIPSCKKDLMPVDNTPPEIKLTAEEVGVTEVWLRLKIQDKSPKSQITISRNDSVIQTFSPSTHLPIDSSSLIYDSGLLPNHDYTYTATLTTNSRTLTADGQIKTMDTTSHDFTWQSWTFGDKGSSILYDVAIIAPDDIWCVGEIYTEDTYTYDSLGNWIQPYNAVHWDGSGWELERILYQGGYWVIKTIYAFNENDISFEYAVRWNGVEFEEQTIPGILIGQSIKKIWGTSSEDLYVVGKNGLIAYYNGQIWQKLESETTLPIQDLWGTIQNDEKIILCPASEIYQTSDKKLLKINNDLSVNDLKWPFPNNRIHSVWFQNNSNIFICGAGVYIRDRIGIYKKYNNLPNIFFRRIRGNDNNDIMLSGDFGFLAHYNGQTWMQYTNFNEIDLFYSLDYKNQIAVAVGEDNSKAVIYMGIKK